MKTKSHTSIVLLLAALLGAAQAESKLTVTCETANPAVLAGKNQTTYIKVGLTGFERRSESDRSPVNIALVLDRSGSMSGAKIEQAKEAARMAVKMLRSDDIFSFITYDSTVNVVVPATKVTNREDILRAISNIQATGNTALFGGVSKGSGEVRKFLSKDRINSVVLLSDGMANVGPAQPSELADLGRSLIKEGISVTTLGLGLDYNEDLMIELADKSDGIHRFIQEPQQLVTFFQEEFGNVLNVVAQHVDILIECAPNVRPIRVIGREADVVGQTVRLKLNQIYGNAEKYVLVEVETPGNQAGNRQDLASATVTYDNLVTKVKDLAKATASCRYVETQEEVDLAVNKDVLMAAVTQIATENNRRAVTLHDEGKMREAIEVQRANVDYIFSNEAQLKDKSGFGQISGINLIGRNLLEDSSSAQSDSDWKEGRKLLRDYHNGAQTSQILNLDSKEIQAALEAEKKRAKK